MSVPGADTTRQRVLMAVAADLRPVRPVLAPRLRAAALTPLALLVTVLAFRTYTRHDLPELGATVAWGLSGLQWLAGLVVLVAALREATPGSALPRRVLWAGGALVAALVLTTTWVTFVTHPTFMPRGSAVTFEYLCFVGPLKAGLPFLLAAAFVAARAFPTTPARVGALCGLATGLMIDSGWRLTCWITAPVHVLTAHILAVVVLAGCGAVLASAFDRLARRFR